MKIYRFSSYFRRVLWNWNNTGKCACSFHSFLSPICYLGQPVTALTNDKVLCCELSHLLLSKNLLDGRLYNSIFYIHTHQKIQKQKLRAWNVNSVTQGLSIFNLGQPNPVPSKWSTPHPPCPPFLPSPYYSSLSLTHSQGGKKINRNPSWNKFKLLGKLT